jgi:hypothetical protein
MASTTPKSEWAFVYRFVRKLEKTPIIKRIENVQQSFGFCLAGVAEGSHHELGAFGFA